MPDLSESPKRRFIDVTSDEIQHAVNEMCVKLGISVSVAGIYSISGAVHNEHQKAIERTKELNEDLNSIK